MLVFVPACLDWILEYSILAHLEHQTSCVFPIFTCGKMLFHLWLFTVRSHKCLSSVHPFSAQNMTSLHLLTWEKRKYWWIEYYVYRCCRSVGSDVSASEMPRLAWRWKNRARKDDVIETMIATMKQTIWVGWLQFTLDESHACLSLLLKLTGGS